MDFLYQQINNDDMIRILNKNDLMKICNNEREYFIHKVVLLKSFFVKTMLDSSFKKEINLKLDISNDTLDKLHKYFYFEKIDININNILELLYCSEYLVLENLKKDISLYLNLLKLDLIHFEKYVKLLEDFYVVLDDRMRKKLNDFIHENYRNYCLSDIISNNELVNEYLLNCEIGDFLKISNNLLSLDKFNNNETKKMLSGIILKDNNWKYLSQNEFWCDFIPLLKILDIKVGKLKNFNENMLFISRFNGKIKCIEDQFKFIKLSSLKVNDYLDVLDEKNKWYLCKILKKIGNNIKIEYRGWSEKFNECLNLEKDIDRLDLAYNNSTNYRDLEINTFMEYKVDNRWLLFKVNVNNDNFIGLKEYKKNSIIKLKHNNLKLIEHPTHIKKIVFYYSNTELTNIKWDDIPYNTYVEE